MSESLAACGPVPTTCGCSLDGGPRLHRSLLLDDRFHGLGKPLRGLVSSLRLGGHGIRRERTCVTASGTTRSTEVAARLNAGIARRFELGLLAPQLLALAVQSTDQAREEIRCVQEMDFKAREPK